ncbi:hypothetical protein N9101_02595 [Akkermansiaceae bacterium]|nr:hypothetical protein [Akkermansiaceae bacterium]
MFTAVQDFDQEIVVLGIIVLTVTGVLFQIWSAIYYKNQVRFAERLSNRISELLEQRKNGATVTYGAHVILEDQSIPENCAAGARAIELERFADYPGMVAIHDLAAEEADADDGRASNSFPNLLISMLLICGLLGTLWSLKETLESPGMRDFVTKTGVPSASSFQEALKPVVEGFGRAFTASIAGVGGTIVLLFVRGLYVHPRREQCFNRLEKLVLNQLLPYFIKPSQDSLREATELLNKGGNRYAEAVSSIDKAAATVVGSVQGLESAAEQANRAFGNDGTIASILSQFTEQVTGLKTATQTIAETGQQTSEILKELTSANQNLNKEVVQYAEQMAAKQSDLVAEVVGSVEALDVNLKTYPASIAKETSQALKGVSEENSKILQSFSEENSKTQKEIAGNNRILADNQATLVSGLQASVTSLEKNQAGLVSGLQTSVNNLASQLEKHPGSLEDMTKLRNDTIETISSALRLQSQGFDKTIAELKSSLTDYPSSLQLSVGKLETTLKTSYQDVGSGWISLSEALKETKEHNLQVAESMKTLSNNLETIVKRATSSGRQTRGAWWRFWKRS